ncbi:putative kelch motif protein, partial [Trypoxylus dichotomus]
SPTVKLQQAGTIIRQASPQQVAGKQVIVQKGGGLIQKSGVQPQIVTLVKTSTGMTVAALPKGSKAIPSTVLQAAGGNNTIVKLVPPNSNKVLTAVKTIPSNMIVNKPGGQIVLSKTAAGQLPTIGNQQVIVVSSNAAIRNIQTVTNAQAVNVTQTKTSTVNVQPITKGTVANLQNVKIGGKPIIMPMGVVGTSKTVTISKNTKQVMIGGKPVTVQMGGAGSKTLTFVQPQQGKILRLPSTSTVSTTMTGDQPKLMVVSRPKQQPAQPTATLAASTSFDGPATTDAALAALAAEAGLIVPEPEKDMSPSIDSTTPSDDDKIMVTESGENKPVTEITTENEVGTTTATIGLFGGSRRYTKLGLKGGSKGIGPPYRPFTYRGGLRGGSKDIMEPTATQTTNTADSTENEINRIAITNGIKDISDCDTNEVMEEVKREPDKSDDVESMLNQINEIDSNCLDEPKVQNEETRDALSILVAVAASDHSKDMNNKTDNVKKDVKDIWYTVGFIKGTSYDVQNYFLLEEDTTDFKEEETPDTTDFPRLNLEPGTAYKFRVAALNSVGRSDWSEVAAFKTCLPGFPGAPSAIKIAKSGDGTHLSWEPPCSSQGEILEYSVYLAVRNNSKDNVTSSSLAFVRVYCGPSNSCTVPNSSLAAAHLDTSTKSAIIFRIAARNEKGYGPATQVRWLQDPLSANKSGVKRASENQHPPLKKLKTDI